MDNKAQIIIEIDKSIPENDENKDLNSMEPKIKKGRNKEKFEDLKKFSTNNKSNEKKLPSASKKPKKRKRLYKRKKEIDEDYQEDSLYIFKNSKTAKKNRNYEDEEESDDNFDDKELKDFLDKKACQKKALLKYKDLYTKKKNNKIIFLKEEDEDIYFNNLKNHYLNGTDNKNNAKENKRKRKNETKSKNKNIEIEIKPFKRLRKNKDNKEMELPLDAECIICCGIITELANPDGCNHDFCKSCLIEWSQRSEKCPMCKANYNNIYFYDNGIKKQLSINEIRKEYKKENNNEDSIDEENIEKICYICKKGEDQNNLLKCDRCKTYFCHYYCCNLKKIPPGKWYCKYCQQEIKEIRENKRRVEHFFW